MVITIRLTWVEPSGDALGVSWTKVEQDRFDVPIKQTDTG